MFRNVDGNWCYDTQTTRVFISDYKLQLLHGKDCIKREVDFEKDSEPVCNSSQQLYYFSQGNHIFYGNSTFFIYSTNCSIQMNDFDDCKRMEFKEV